MTTPRSDGSLCGDDLVILDEAGRLMREVLATSPGVGRI